jgi:hypothetical protein
MLMNKDVESFISQNISYMLMNKDAESFISLVIYYSIINMLSIFTLTTERKRKTTTDFHSSQGEREGHWGNHQ